MSASTEQFHPLERVTIGIVAGTAPTLGIVAQNWAMLPPEFRAIIGVLMLECVRYGIAYVRRKREALE